MVNITDLCTNCVQIITNPICPLCLSNHILEWLRDKNIPKEKFREIERLFIKLITKAEETPSDITCIICGCKKVNLCLHCFTLKAEIIIEENINSNITQEFEEDFNTILWRI